VAQAERRIAGKQSQQDAGHFRNENNTPCHFVAAYRTSCTLWLAPEPDFHRFGSI